VTHANLAYFFNLGCPCGNGRFFCDKETTDYIGWYVVRTTFVKQEVQARNYIYNCGCPNLFFASGNYVVPLSSDLSPEFENVLRNLGREIFMGEIFQ